MPRPRMPVSNRGRVRKFVRKGLTAAAAVAALRAGEARAQDGSYKSGGQTYGPVIDIPDSPHNEELRKGILTPQEAWALDHDERGAEAAQKKLVAYYQGRRAAEREAQAAKRQPSRRHYSTSGDHVLSTSGDHVLEFEGSHMPSLPTHPDSTIWMGGPNSERRIRNYLAGLDTEFAHAPYQWFLEKHGLPLPKDLPSQAVWKHVSALTPQQVATIRENMQSVRKLGRVEITDADFFAHVERVMPLVRAITGNEYSPNTGRITCDAITLLNRVNPTPEQRKYLNTFASSKRAKEVVATLKNNLEQHAH